MRVAPTVLLALVLLASGLGCTSMLAPQDDLARKVDYLRTDVEKLAKQQEQLLAEVRALQGGVPAPPQAPAAPPASAPAPPAPSLTVEELAPQPPTPPALESGQLSADPAAVYQKAYDLLAAGKVPESQAAFAQFIRTYPQSDLADNAQYWIGEGFYVQKSFADAKGAFQMVLDHFPFGNKVPDALYKRALCEGELGDKAEERDTLREVVEQYPFSDASVKARDLLKKLG